MGGSIIKRIETGGGLIMSEQSKKKATGPVRVKTKRGRTSPRKRATKSPPRLLPPWKVILHNDDNNELEDVVRTIYRLTPLSPEEATTRTLEAHESGAALLLVTHQERAELYVEQFASCGLTATAEPDA